MSFSKLTALAFLVFVVLPLSANTIHVPTDKPTIQAAIDAASDGDTILVSDGTYKENIDFKGKAITVKSVNGPAPTVIDGGALDTVVKFSTNEGSLSVLDGFTIRNGAVNQNSISSGSGIYVGNSSPTIINNIVTANGGCEGAGIDVQFGSPLIQGNTITHNSQSGCLGGTGGGGILLGGAAQAQILTNTISQNSTGADGGGISLFAAGNPVIRGNTISNNTAGGSGGGIAMANQSDAVVTDNLIISNSASLGGGVATLVPSGANGPVFTNNTFASNTAPQGGAQVYFSGFPNQTQFWNNIFFGIAAQIAVDCDTSYSSQAPIFKFNNAFNPSGTTYAGSCGGETGTNGNISADPLFVNSASDFHLQSTSPAVDAGSNSALDVPQQDIVGTARILDGNADCIATVDMGAYEFARSSSLTLNPTSLPFPDQVVGTTSSPLSSIVTNIGNSPSTVCAITATGDFAPTNTCGSSIASKGTCAVSVTFTPSAHASSAGLLQIITNDAGSPQSIVLSGKGVIPVVSLSATPLNFSAQQVGTTSAAQSATLNNTGDGPLTISNVAVTGDFSETNTCGTTVAPGTSCPFSLTFAPTTAGNRAGTLTITDNAAGSPRTINLTGAATDFALAAASGGSTSATVTAGSPATYNLQVSPLNGFSNPVALACTGAANLSTCTVSSTPITPSGSASPFTVTVTTMAPSLIVPRVNFRRMPPLALYPLILALLLLFSAIANQSRRGRRALLSSFAIFLFTLICIAGCGGGNSTPSNPGTQKGTYTLTVTGSSNGVSHPLSLSLTVN